MGACFVDAILNLFLEKKNDQVTMQAISTIFFLWDGVVVLPTWFRLGVSVLIGHVGLTCYCFGISVFFFLDF